MPLLDRPESEFRTSPRAFLSRRVTTGYRLNHAGFESGRRHVYLTSETVNGEPVATLQAAPPSRWIGRASPIPVWWVPQGGCCDVPVRPGAEDPRIVFTPDFSGCSLLVDQLDAERYRVYHVTGGDAPFRTEYQGRPHGLGLAGFTVFSDYGESEVPRAFICMQYDEDRRRWMILAQSQTGICGLGGSRDGALTSPDILQVRSLQGRYVSDLSAESADRPADSARHGTIPLSEG